jgi:hypothetical protein
MPAGYGHIRYTAALMPSLVTLLAVVLIALNASAELPAPCQAAIDSDLKAGATLREDRPGIDPNRIWMKLRVDGRDATILHDCGEESTQLRNVLIEFPNEKKATSYFEELRDKYLRVEGKPTYGIGDIPGELPKAAEVLRRDFLSDSRKQYRWENETRVVSLDLSKEDDDTWTVAELRFQKFSGK